MKKFEYKMITVSREHMKKDSFQTEMLDKFNELGNEGWEIISAEGLNGSSILWKVAETTELIFIFKREK
ncbi:DUF4177 domain-containing protein [Ferruginibacter sp. SUN106]|uniref:DUF4177 domain-containing protein n=1 Tax=Ferruginibacter sp. SUN106 TaxID=2978348 RepID=UPI003D368982